MSKEANQILIEDPTIEPYVITQEKHVGFCITERSIRHSKTGADPVEYLKPICYPTSIEGALEYILRNKMCDKENYSSISEYISEYRKIKESIYSILK